MSLKYTRSVHLIQFDSDDIHMALYVFELLVVCLNSVNMFNRASDC